MHKLGLILLVIAIGTILLAGLLPLPSPDPTSVLSPPSLVAWAGTDALGRDVVYRTIVGVAYTVRQAAVVLVTASVIGLAAGVVSALFYDKWPDRLIVIAAESLRSYPALLLILLFATVNAPPSILFVAYFWIPIWRTLRFELTLQQREPYVLWTLLVGVSRPRILVSDVFPNVLPRIAPYAAGVLSEIIAAQAAVEFLGFGPRLEQPTLGRILLEAGQVGFGAAWVWMPSVIALMLLVLGIAFGVRRYRQAIRWVPIG